MEQIKEENQIVITAMCVFFVTLIFSRELLMELLMQ